MHIALRITIECIPPACGISQLVTIGTKPACTCRSLFTIRRSKSLLRATIRALGAELSASGTWKILGVSHTGVFSRIWDALDRGLDHDGYGRVSGDFKGAKIGSLCVKQLQQHCTTSTLRSRRIAKIGVYGDCGDCGTSRTQFARPLRKNSIIQTPVM